MAELKHWEDDKSLYLFTSLTSGSSHIITATSRIETILKNARIPFTYIDTATNESAKKLFQRRARGKKLPLLVKEGFVIADLDEVEELNEFGELEETIGEVTTTGTSITAAPATTKPLYQGTAGAPSAPSGDLQKAAPATAEAKKEYAAPQQPSIMAQLAQETAARAKEQAKRTPTPLTSTTKSTTASEVKAAPQEKENPLSPKGIPLPASPALTSPTMKSPPADQAPPHRLSSSNSVSSHVPETSEEPLSAHRGSQVAVATNEEIKRIESERSIAEESEEDDEEDEEESSEDEDSADDELEAEKAATPAATETMPQDLSAPVSKKADPLLTPVIEVATPFEEKSNLDEEHVAPGEEASTSSDSESDVEDEKAQPTASSSSSAAAAPAVAASKASTTTEPDAKLAAKTDALTIQDQEAAVGENATKSVGD